jgi:acetoin utilization deacetylase AcuC-like enzyme
MDGLAARDRLVLERCRAAGLPIAVTMAGGYARQVEDIATIHARTVQIAAEVIHMGVNR